MPAHPSLSPCHPTPRRPRIMPSSSIHRGGAMPQYLSPGVYVEEIDSGARPIEGVGTAGAAFIGLAEKGPFNEPTLCSNWTQFVSTFGGFACGTHLAHAVYGYYLNGGGNSYIVRIGGDNGTAPTAR